jgi:4-amino-4-deoxy-L-arabinose transferase-like glycosyltransferase
MGLAIGLAMLTKGPPVLMFLGTTLVAAWLLRMTIEEPARSQQIVWRRAVPRAMLGFALVIAIALLVGLPWAISVERARPGTLSAMFSNEIVARGTSAKEGHSGPPGFYVATFWVTYFPWCLFWPAAIVQAWKRRHLPWVRFSLAAVLGPWIFLEIYRTKLPHYWLPSYPFMAILTADVLLRGMRARIVDLRDRPFLIGAMVWAGAASAVAVLLLVVPFLGDRPWASLPVAILLAGGIVILAWGTVALLRAKRLQAASVTMGLGTAAVIAFAACAYLPRVGALTLPERLAAQLREIGATVPGQVQMIGFKEPSLAFHQGGTLREQRDGKYLINTPHEQWPMWTVIDDATWRRTVAAAPEAEGRMIPRASLSGSAYADGKHSIVVHVLEKKIVPTTP